MHVVIIGGGFAGMSAARVLGNTEVQVTLIDRQNYHLFQPLLYQVALAELGPDDIAQPIRQILRGYENIEVRLGTVTRIEPEKQRVILDDGEHLAYDRLILAAGATTSYFGRDEWEKFAPGLKTVPDAIAIRRRILESFEQAEWAHTREEMERLLTFVVVGGGPTGVELAGAIADIACRTLRDNYRHVDTCGTRVVLVEMMDEVLPPFPPRLRKRARALLEDMGIEVRTGSKVEEVDENGIIVNGERIAASTVLWGAGVQAVPLTRYFDAPLDEAGRIVVRPDLSVPGHHDVFAVGDLARYEYDGKMVPGVAPAAMQAGRRAARNVLADARGEPRRPLRYRDKGSLVAIGRSKGVAEVYGVKTSGTLAFGVWAVVHLFWLIGFDNRTVVFFRWFWNWATRQRPSRLIVREEERIPTAPRQPVGGAV